MSENYIPGPPVRFPLIIENKSLLGKSFDLIIPGILLLSVKICVMHEDCMTICHLVIWLRLKVRLGIRGFNGCIGFGECNQRFGRQATSPR